MRCSTDSLHDKPLAMKHFLPHADLRCAQRGYNETDVELALCFGTRQRSFKARTKFVLTDRAICKAGLPDKLRGLCLIVAPDGTIVTVMRHYKTIKRRPSHLRRAGLIEALETVEMQRELRGVA